MLAQERLEQLGQEGKRHPSAQLIISNAEHRQVVVVPDVMEQVLVGRVGQLGRVGRDAGENGLAGSGIGSRGIGAVLAEDCSPFRDDSVQ